MAGMLSDLRLNQGAIFAI